MPSGNRLRQCKQASVTLFFVVADVRFAATYSQLWVNTYFPNFNEGNLWILGIRCRDLVCDPPVRFPEPILIRILAMRRETHKCIALLDKATNSIIEVLTEDFLPSYRRIAKCFDQRKNKIFDPFVAVIVTVTDENSHIINASYSTHPLALTGASTHFCSNCRCRAQDVPTQSLHWSRTSLPARGNRQLRRLAQNHWAAAPRKSAPNSTRLAARSTWSSVPKRCRNGY